MRLSAKSNLPEVHDSPPWGNTTKAIVASTFLIVAALVIWRFQFLLMPLTIAVILSYLLHPPIRFLNQRLNIHRTYVVIAVYLTLLLLLTGAMIALGLAAVEQASRLAVALPNLIPRLIAQGQELTNQWSDVEFVIGPYEFSFGAAADLINWNAIADEARSLLQQVLGQGTVALANVAQATLSTVGNGLTVFFVSIYISIEGPRIGQVIGDVAHQPGYRKDAERLIIETLRIWNSYLRGQIILAILIFVVVSLALSILQVNNALALGLLSGVLEFLPIIGPIIGSAAAVIVAFFQTPPWGLTPWTYALIVLAVMVVIQQVEGNILVPRMVGDSVNVHPLAIMIGVLMGASLAGLLGAVLAAPVVGTLKLLGVYVWRKMLDLHPFPEDLAGEPAGGDRTGDASAAGSPVDMKSPLTLRPVLKDYVWGGRNLETVLGRALPEGRVAESWEIAAHPNGQSVIEAGPLAGMTLAAALKAFGAALAGARHADAAAAGRFPILIKLLDAQRPLSVQVHPQDDYALAHEGEPGKTEMWIVLHAEPGAEIVFGFSRKVTPMELENILASGETDAIEALWHRAPVRAGDVVFVPAGAVHALGAGILVAEVQQNSDSTYRLSDWGRPREIHVRKALDVLDFDLIRPGLTTPQPLEAADVMLTGQARGELLAQCPHFVVERYRLMPGAELASRTAAGSFTVAGVLSGKATLTADATDDSPTVLCGVSWALLPAALGGYRLTATGDGETIALRIYTP